MMLNESASAEQSDTSAPSDRTTSSRAPQKLRVLSDQEILSFDTGMHPYTLESIIVAGNPIGLIEALAQAAKKKHHDAYGFVTRYAYGFIFDMAFGDRRKSKGRHGNPLARLRKDFVHAQRAELWESYRESQPGAEELKIQKTDSRKLKEIKRKRGTNSLSANASDGVISRFMSNKSSTVSARTIKASRLLVKNNQHRYYMSPRRELNAILGLREFQSDKITEADYERAILGELYKTPASRNLYEPEYKKTSTKPGRPQTGAIDRAILDLLPKAEQTCDRPWQRNAASLERAVRAGNLLAVLDGLKQFNSSGEHVPPWLLLTAARWVLWLLVTNGGRRIGRHGNPLAAVREELTHHMRCYAIELALMSQRHVENLVNISKVSGRYGRVMLEAMVSEQKLVGKTETSAIRLAVKNLEGLPWAGSESALARSYRRFRVDLAFRNRVWNPTPELLRALKLPPLPANFSH